MENSVLPTIEAYFSNLTEPRQDRTKLLEAIRPHWGIEKELHWVLHIAFDEDHCRVNRNHGAVNLVLLWHIALN